MGKKLKAITESPLDQLSNLIDTKIETKKEKNNNEIKIPLTTAQKEVVIDLISKHSAKKTAIEAYDSVLLNVKEKIAEPFYIKESLKEGKSIGSYFIDVGLTDHAQFIPVDNWNDISISETDNMKDKLERVKNIIGEKMYQKFITKITEIKIKSTIIEDKEKLLKFVQLVKANPEFANYFEIIEKYKVEKGGLDLSFQLTTQKREQLITEVPIRSASIKVVPIKKVQN